MNNMAFKPIKFCKIIDHEQDDSLILPKKFALKCGNKLPKKEVYLKVPNGLSWPVDVTYSRYNNEVWFGKGWSAFRDHYSIGPRSYLEFTYDGVAKFDVIIFDINGSEINYKPDHVAASCPSPTPDDSQRFYKIIVDPECDRFRLPLTFTQRYGAGLPDYVFIQVPSSTSMWEVELVHAKDGEIHMGDRWREFQEYYDIYSGNSLVFEFHPKHKFIDVWIYDETATEKDFLFNLDDIHVEGYDSDSDEDDSSVFLEEIHGKARGKEKVRVEDYYQDDNRTTIGIVEHGSITPGTKRKRLEESDGSGEDLVGCSVGKSARRLKHSGGNTFTKWKFIEELQPYNAYRLCFPTEFTRSTKITPGMEVILQNVEGTEWKVRVKAKDGTGQYCLGAGWCKYLVDNFVVVGSTMEFKFVRSSDNTIEARVVEVGPNPEELFKHVKREGGGYVVKLPELRWAKQLNESNRYHLTMPKFLSNVIAKAKNGVVILQDQKGRKWPVQIIQYTQRKNRILSTGWTDFLVGSKVYIGSTILFEMIRGTNNMIQVQILKKGHGRVPFVMGPRCK